MLPGTAGNQVFHSAPTDVNPKLPFIYFNKTKATIKKYKNFKFHWAQAKIGRVEKRLRESKRGKLLRGP